MAAFDGSIKIDTKLDSKGIQAGLNKMVSGVKTGMKAAVAAVAAGAAACAKFGSDFETSMSQVAATMGIEQAGEDFESLASAAQEAGATTKFSASQAGEALNYLALAGYNAEKSIQALPTVLDLAAAGGIDLGYASDMVTDSMSALGLETSQLKGFVDELAKTSQKSNTNIAQLGEGILTVGGTARDLAGGTVELSTALGILADNGIKGAEGGTALRNIILSLSAPTDKAAEMMDKLGLSVFDAQGKLRPLNEVFKDLDIRLSKMNDKEKINVLNTIFNKVDLKSANAMLANCGARFDELSGYIKDSDGAAESMAKTMNDNLKGQLDELSSALEGLAISVYEGIEEPMKDAVSEATIKIGELTESVSNGELKNAVSSVGSLLGRMISIAVSAANTALPLLVRAVSLLSQNLDIVTNSILASIAAIVGWKTAAVVVTVIQSMTKAWQGAQIALNLYTAAIAANNTTAATGATVQVLLAQTLSAGQLVIGVLTGKVSLATAATVAWNAATSISIATIGGVVTVVVALAAALGALYAKQQLDIIQSQTAADIAGKRVAKLREEVAERKKLSEVQADALAGNLVEITNSERLWSELSKIADENGRVDEANRARAAFITGELSSALGMEIQLVDGQIQKYSELRSSIDDIIAAKKAQIFLESEEENYKNALISLKKQELEHAAQAKAVYHWENAMKETGIKLDELRAQKSEATSRNEKKRIEEKIESLQKEYDAQKKWYDATSEEYKLQENEIKGYYETVGRYETAATAMTEKNYDKVIDVISSQYPGAFKTAEDLVGKSVAEQEHTLQHQAEVAEIYAQQLRDRMNEGWSGVTEDMVAEAEKQAQEAAAQWRTVGSNMVSGTVEGVNNSEGELMARLKSMASSALSAAKEALGIHSPSRVMRDEVGRYIAEGVAVGITDHKYKVSDAFERMFDDLQLKRDMGVISEAEYYSQLETLRDKHIKKGTSDWWKYTKDIIAYKEKAEAESRERELAELQRLREREKITDEQYYRQLLEYRNKYFDKSSEEWREYSDEVVDYLDSRKKEIIDSYAELSDSLSDEIDAMADKLSDSGSLYDKIVSKYKSVGTGEEYTVTSISLHDFDKDIALMNEYADALERVQKRGAPTEFFDILRDMDMESGLEFANALNNSTDEEFAKYISDWQKKEAAAQRIAENLYAQDSVSLKEKYIDELRAFYDSVPDEFFDCGIQSGNAFGNALVETVSAAVEKTKQIISSFTASFTSTMSGALSAAGGVAGTTSHSTSYNFYSSGQTVSQQLAEARAADTVSRLRGDL